MDNSRQQSRDIMRRVINSKSINEIDEILQNHNSFESPLRVSVSLLRCTYMNKYQLQNWNTVLYDTYINLIKNHENVNSWLCGLLTDDEYIMCINMYSKYCIKQIKNGDIL